MSWFDQAACQNMAPDIFFPEIGQSADQARTICAACEVRVECLGYALDQRIGQGVWGGLTDQERKRLRRRKAA